MSYAASLTTSEFGYRLITAFEGFFPKRYKCPAGVWTQGYGHTAMSGGKRLGGTWTKEEALDVLRETLSRKYEPGVRAALRREPTQGQFDAFVSLAFNVGVDGFAKSSVVKHFNRGNDAQAAAAFGLWVKAKVRGVSTTLPGLVRRRASEALAYQDVQDANFDGVRQSDEPIYGRMSQRVDEAAEPVASSGTLKGAGAAAAVGGAVTVDAATGVVLQAEPYLSRGTLIGLVVGTVILATAAYACYRKWIDMGRPPIWR